MKTFHAPPERSEEKIIYRQHESLLQNEYLSELINALPYVVTILNSNRQIVFSNQNLISALKVKDFKDFLGKRVGEALNCIHSKTLEEGCGTSENCKVCGAVNTITASMAQNRKVVNEWRITTMEHEGIEEFFDYEVTASPFVWNGESFTILSMSDISGIKRKKMLEKIFFHDILNTAGNLRNLSEIFQQVNDEIKKKELLSLLEKISNELIEEIQEQKQLSEAESGDLKPNFSLINTIDIMEFVVAQFERKVNDTISIHISNDADNLSFSNDRTILIRILKNMVKNALEASEPGQVVTLSAEQKDTSVRFNVHNEGFIPRNIQLQIFKRSFSTKGSDRGLGTYSMKLLGERYLKGKIGFTSDENHGTDFYFDLPLV